MTSVTTLIDGLLASVQNRLHLFSVELQEEKVRFLQLFAWVAGAVFAGMMALGFGTFAVLYSLSQSARLPALLGVTVFYALGCGLLCLAVQRRLKSGIPFEASLAGIRKDRACIPSRN
jgi:uncharacterized membrane protein YqjE